MKKWPLVVAPVMLAALAAAWALRRGNRAEPPAPPAGGYQSVFSIDAGRKYVGVKALKAIIAQAAAQGFTAVQLVLGNDGLRLLLADMSVTAGGHTYRSAAVTAALQAGNRQYYADPHGNALTQAQMDELLAYAQTKHVAVIPVLNSPGHMDAILTAMRRLGIRHPQYLTSARTVDLNNAAAVAFTQALIGKYIRYFAGRVAIFNLGADEYANDITNAGGWQLLQQTGDYRKFIAYVNQLAQVVGQNGMRPMVFNDGIYYNRDTTFGTFDRRLLVAYWTGGWPGYLVAPPAYLRQKGLTLYNTNEAWYYVLGHLKRGSLYSLPQALANVKRVRFTTLPKDRGLTPIAGSIQAVWADEPAAPLNLPQILHLMAAYGQAYRAEMPVGATSRTP